MNFSKKRLIKRFFLGAVVLLALFFVWQWFQVPPTEGDWQEPLRVQAHADFNGDYVTVKNVRNFRYKSDENFIPGYYDQTYDLSKLEKIWYITNPFKGRKFAAHSFLSFEFSDKKYLSISIEARKKKGQNYSILAGIVRTYPLMYIAADERDTVLLRANVRNEELYMYPVKATPEQARLLFKDMLGKMNQIAENPVWYNTLTANCTSSIADHVNKIWPERLPNFIWQEWVTGYAEKFIYDEGFFDTDLSFEQARQKYYIAKRSQEIGDAEDYSVKLREFNN